MSPFNRSPKLRTFVLLLYLCLVSFVNVQGFFIDLEALGFTTSDDDSSSVSDAKNLMVASPSEQKEVEIESKSDPHKSVKLTLGELKHLILGTVKDLTPSPRPINIKILSGGKKADKNVSAKKTKLKFKQVDTVNTDYGDAMDLYDHTIGKYFKSKSKSKYPDLTIDSDNEITDYADSPRSPPKSIQDIVLQDDGWLTSAKAVLRAPANVYKKFRYSSKAAQKPRRRRPIPDITYRDDRRQRKRHPPRRRSRIGYKSRPSRPRYRGRRRRPQPRRRPPTYVEDDFVAAAEGYNRRRNKYSARSEYGYQEYMDDDSFYEPLAWDRMDRFDSTMPRDDAPANMVPPMAAPSTSYY